MDCEKRQERSRAYQERYRQYVVQAMHKYLENYVLGKGYEDLTELGQETKRMAEKVIEVGLAPVSGYFGSEVTVYYPGLYAGSTDLVGIHNDKETMIDFKQANRPKREEWIGDYKLQAGAYAMAHDYVHGSNIEQCCDYGMHS